MQRIKIIAFTHKTTDVNDIGKLHIEDNALQLRLQYLKLQTGLDELFYLSTCNRVEFMLVTSAVIDSKFLKSFFTLCKIINRIYILRIGLYLRFYLLRNSYNRN